MDSKFENIFLPLQESGFQVDVAFALSTGRLIFSNPRKVKEQTEDMARVFANETSLLSYMKAHYLGVVSKKGFVYRRVEDPHLNMEYEEQLMQLIEKEFKKKRLSELLIMLECMIVIKDACTTLARKHWRDTIWW
jgi:hypothetical protein